MLTVKCHRVQAFNLGSTCFGTGIRTQPMGAAYQYSPYTASSYGQPYQYPAASAPVASGVATAGRPAVVAAAANKGPTEPIAHSELITRKCLL